jgi:ubiquinone/menaquinone biosynthesis C-methylase UbiE
MHEMTLVVRSKAEARASSNRLSKWYDLIAGRSKKKFREKGLEILNAKPGESFLELGCGTGHNLLALAQKVGSSDRVLGIDLSEGMLQ